MLLASLGIGWMVLLFFGGIVLFFLLLGLLTAGTGGDLVDWDPAGRAVDRVLADVEDEQSLRRAVDRDE